MGIRRDSQQDDLLGRSQHGRVAKDFTDYTNIMATAQVVLVILYFTCTDYDYEGDSNNGLLNIYQMYTGIALMMLVGFGYLMTFLKHYGLGAVGWTMLITCLGIEWSLLTLHFFNQIYEHGNHANEWSKAHITIEELINANFAAAAFLITFGALIGKVGPKQTCLLVLLESVFYSLNANLLAYGYFGITDSGGTITIHMFGAYYGLAVAFMLGVPRDKGTADQESTYTTDLFSLFGTVFLWLYWPSFVAAPLEQNSPEQNRALVNCVLSLVGSTVATFTLSARYEQRTSSTARLNPVHIQNSTLAGGVAIGAICNLSIGPGVALLVGILAGVVSTTGYSYAEQFLRSTIGVQIHDTCGIHYLHGMPSVLGGLASVIIAAIYPNPEAYTHGENKQWYMQLISIVVTLAIAISSGLLTGRLLSTKDMISFNDSEYWHVHKEQHTRAVAVGGIGLTGKERDVYLSESKAGIPNVGAGGGMTSFVANGMVDVNMEAKTDLGEERDHEGFSDSQV